jgi:hypothetical protein
VENPWHNSQEVFYAKQRFNDPTAGTGSLSPLIFPNIVDTIPA